MSTATAIAPVAVAKSPVQSFNEFVTKHRPAVQRDVNDARNRGLPRFVLLVTPEEVAIRTGESSSVHLDISGPGCQNAKWLRDLYRIIIDETESGSGLEVDFTCRDVPKVTMPDGSKKTVPMLEVRFKYPARARKLRGQR